MDTWEVIAAKLEPLMKEKGWTQAQLASRAGVSQRTVGNLLNPGVIGTPTLSVLERISGALSIPVWAICLPNTPADLDNLKSIAKLVEGYLQCDKESQVFIFQTIEREVTRRPAQVVTETGKLKQRK